MKIEKNKNAMNHQPHIIQEQEAVFKIGEIKGRTVHYDFAKIIDYLNYKGKILFGQQFKIYDQDLPLLYKLIIHFIKDEPTCKKYGLDPSKGILLSGPVGCGKTTLMRLLKHIKPHISNYAVVPCRDIVFEFNKKGYEVIEKYGNSNMYCFDDLGVEAKGKHFGADCNVLGEILLSRYELFVKARKLTYVTTNLNAKEIEERYGARVRSRMRQLFNLVAFEKETTDKRC
ncbi:ATPase [Algibacter mikhailovii]|uniref:ATPase n=1 Tax=Algibacter mikhailovii TaxID=425498 RepID=UPI0024940C17|nr:ATPase [Algibacter mikhailovii]